MDWNRATFEFHVARRPGDQDFDQRNGLETTDEIYKYRLSLGLTNVIGCAPKSYCMTCAPIGSAESILPLLSQALAEVVINEERKEIPRYIISNTGGIRLDLHKGPFTTDDTFTISPSRNALLYIPLVPRRKAMTLLNKLNSASPSQKQDPAFLRFEYDLCVDPDVVHVTARDGASRGYALGGITRRQEADLSPGYTTTDDFGSDGDDTPHSSIPYYDLPNYYQGVAGLGDIEDGRTDVVDVVFVDL
ncbi:hypothetical protein KJ359_001175 [Pestalotiopsis sp. 9143b]|nr:hypothetical protein KJ359_001175 [Pestalotiopsis sp. 9143b]